LNEKNLSGDVKNIIFPIVSQMKAIDMSSFSKAVIHGDMQRKHVLKNIKNEYCILDFGCARTDYKVYDLSTYLAWFCLSHDTWAKKDEIFEKVIQKYTFIHNLSEKELISIPLLIKAAYASYYLKTTLLIQEGDLSDETKKWHNDSMKMLSY
jgi:Ser/Thr protein kinase RdoA (MazF antagonist)